MKAIQTQNKEPFFFQETNRMIINLLADQSVIALHSKSFIERRIIFLVIVLKIEELLQRNA
jgi:hypothetical protein